MPQRTRPEVLDGLQWNCRTEMNVINRSFNDSALLADGNAVIGWEPDISHVRLDMHLLIVEHSRYIHEESDV